MAQRVVRIGKLLLGMWLGLSLWSSNAVAQTLAARVDEALRTRITEVYNAQDLRAGSELIRALSFVVRFYEQRNFQSAWSTDGCLGPQAVALLDAIREADHEGLNPQDYHLAALESVIPASSGDRSERCLGNTEELTDADLLLTDTFLLYGAHLLASRLDPRTIDSLWVAPKREIDLAQTLHTALAANRITETLLSLMPAHRGYAQLRLALVRYREFAARGGWPIVPNGPKLSPGMYDTRTPLLRTRLIAEGDLVAPAPTPPPASSKKSRKSRRKIDTPSTELAVDELLFDKPLVEAVRKFQRRNGLGTDGTVGPGTLAALNVSAQERVQQIQMNLERWRWMPSDFGPRYVLINVPDFTLNVVENGQSVLTMRAVVGKEDWRTPVFSAPLTSVVLNPPWFVPRSIAVKEILPILRRDPGYLTRQRMSVAVKTENGFAAVNPRSIKWGRVSAENFPYRFRQAPGDKNALGQMKFLMQNPFHIYLHDTPSTALFNRVTRASSHGCIRIEKPLALAEYVLRGDSRWTAKTINAALAQQKTRSVDLPEPIPVHLLYWTAWTGDDQSVHFRPDLYKYDTLLAEALQGKRPAISRLVQLPAPPPPLQMELPSEPPPVVGEVSIPDPGKPLSTVE